MQKIVLRDFWSFPDLLGLIHERGLLTPHLKDDLDDLLERSVFGPDGDVVRLEAGLLGVWVAQGGASWRVALLEPSEPLNSGFGASDV